MAILYGAGTLYVDALPTHDPGAHGAKRAIHNTTGEKYRWVSGTTWEVEPEATLVYIYDGWVYDEGDEEYNCSLPDITPDVNGPFLAYNINENCQSWFQWDIVAQQWRPYVLYYGQGPTGTANRMAVFGSSGNLTSYNSARVVGSEFVFDGNTYIGTLDNRRTSGREPFIYKGRLVVSHVNGNQFVDTKISAFGAIFDSYNEDRNQNEFYVRTNTTYRADNTPGNYRAPIVGDLMFNQMAKITRKYLAPYDPNLDGSGVTWIDIKVSSVNPTTNDVGVNIGFYTRKNTDPQWKDGGSGNLTLQLKENLDIRLPGYANTRDDASTPVNVLSTTADGTVNSHPVRDLFSAVPQLTDAAAANNSIYYSTTQSKLVYKDPGGTVNPLY